MLYHLSTTFTYRETAVEFIGSQATTTITRPDQIQNITGNLHRSHDSYSVYVPGAGFSGFWYTLGRLSSTQQPAQTISTKAVEPEYHCFSAGCLAVMATLLNLRLEHVYELALSIQNEWKRGEISRYDVVPRFIDQLLIPLDEFETLSNSSIVSSDAELQEMLSRVTVYTTTWSNAATSRIKGFSARRATSIIQLKEMLLQTTWIPFATGWGLWRTDDDGQRHLDGGASMVFHPKCDVVLSLPPITQRHNWNFYFNFLNPNLGQEGVQRFYQTGVLNGL